jgi:hypothetical protein
MILSAPQNALRRALHCGRHPPIAASCPYVLRLAWPRPTRS